MVRCSAHAVLCCGLLAAVALGGVVDPSKEYVGEFTSGKGLTWMTEGAADAKDLPTTKEVREALKHVLLETFSKAKTFEGAGDLDIEPADVATCGPAEAGADWKQWGEAAAPDNVSIKNVLDKMKTYTFTKKVGPAFIGTDGIELQAFDGTIRVIVKDKSMRLVIHNGGDRASSNVRSDSQGGTKGCPGVNMMTLQIQLNKFGLAMPAIPHKIWIGKGFVGKYLNLPDGLHLHEWFGAESGVWGLANTVPSDKYAIKLRVAVDATATLGHDGKWGVADKARGIKICSPGIEFAGDLAESSLISGLKAWGVIDKFADVGGLLQDPLYCALKYTVPGIPWLGHISTFVAGDAEPAKTHMSFTVNTQLSAEPRGGGPRTLSLGLGSQLDVPTMNFIAHIIRTAQRITDDLDEKEEARKAPKTAAQQESEAERKERILKQLKAMGFDKEVLEAMRVINLYAAKITRSTAEASKFITAFFNNVFTLIFSQGNELEAKFKGGLHLGRNSAEGLQGDLTGKVDQLWLKTTAVETPVYPHLFLMTKAQLEEFSQRAVQAGGMHQAVAGDGGSADEAFTLKGKITLAEAKNLAITGSAKVSECCRMEVCRSRQLALALGRDKSRAGKEEGGAPYFATTHVLRC